MKFVSYECNGLEQYGIVDDQTGDILNLSQIAIIKEIDDFPLTLLEGIKQGDHFITTIQKVMDSLEQDYSSFLLKKDSLKWLSPISHPPKNVICVGKNYREHAIEMGSEADIPEHVMIFTKATTAITGHLSNIDLHSEVTSELDYEGELAVVIGKGGKNISESDALKHVFGYTILNDITARDLQKRHKQFFIGKSLDTSCPIGPWIIHHSQIKNPNNLDITTKVNNEVRQNSNTKHFIFPIEEVISTLSKGMTLEPGDIIATGTPAGVGKGFKPPIFLKRNDQIDITIEGIGTLTNKVQ
ncbi:fumarylacetoacetate hydrolase family protein [Heyndrickxia sp. NPDC080065]|uniref:fumarylacetoacetate hydrolase family protein n=1 Tax=Heyndrickxia sp. NPDC080065 TaxID=3390568 RepID=UPI003D01B85D